MLKYRADRSHHNSDDSVSWFANWAGGSTLSKIENCRTNLSGDPRVTAYVTGEADTWFSIPAKCWYRGCRVTGYITSDDDGMIFRHCYY